MAGAPLLVLMCGLSFAGKSTLSAALARELPARIVSLDAINAERGLLGGQGIPGEEWARTHDLAEARVTGSLRDGADVILDDTGSPRFVRDRWRRVADGAGAGFAIVWVTVDEALQRRRLEANRSSGERPDVTDEVMREHRRTFEPPVDESPIVVSAERTSDPSEVRRVVGALRAVAGVAR